MVTENESLEVEYDFMDSEPHEYFQRQKLEFGQYLEPGEIEREWDFATGLMREDLGLENRSLYEQGKTLMKRIFFGGLAIGMLSSAPDLSDLLERKQEAYGLDISRVYYSLVSYIPQESLAYVESEQDDIIG